MKHTCVARRRRQARPCGRAALRDGVGAASERAPRAWLREVCAGWRKGEGGRAAASEHAPCAGVRDTSICALPARASSPAVPIKLAVTFFKQLSELHAVLHAALHAALCAALQSLHR
eukprot:364620-Chlamydomonas_euryale.AAC.4